jgi:hypothetical protein
MVAFALTLGVLGAASSACNKSVENQRAEAEKAGAKAKEKARSAQEATHEAAEEHNELLAAIARERKEYIVKLDEEVRAIERRILALDPIVDTYERDRLTQRRELLRADLDAIQKSTNETWAAVKAKIDRDLADDSRT